MSAWKRRKWRINYSMGYRNYFEIVESVELAHSLGAAEMSYIEMQPANEEDFRGDMANCTKEDGGALLKEALARLTRYGIWYKLQPWPEDHCPVVKVPHVAEGLCAAPQRLRATGAAGA